MLTLNISVYKQWYVPYGMHSCIPRVVVSDLAGWMVQRQIKCLNNTCQRTAQVVKPFGTDKSVPYEHTGVFRRECIYAFRNLTDWKRQVGWASAAKKHTPGYSQFCTLGYARHATTMAWAFRILLLCPPAVSRRGNKTTWDLVVKVKMISLRLSMARCS